MTRARAEIVGAAFDLTSHIRGCRAAPQILRDQGLSARMTRLAKQGVIAVDGGDIVGPASGDATTTPRYMDELLAMNEALRAGSSRHTLALHWHIPPLTPWSGP